MRENSVFIVIKKKKKMQAYVNDDYYRPTHTLLDGARRHLNNSGDARERYEWEK